MKIFGIVWSLLKPKWGSSRIGFHLLLISKMGLQEVDDIGVASIFRIEK